MTFLDGNEQPQNALGARAVGLGAAISALAGLERFELVAGMHPYAEGHIGKSSQPKSKPASNF